MSSEGPTLTLFWVSIYLRNVPMSPSVCLAYLPWKVSKLSGLQEMLLKGNAKLKNKLFRSLTPVTLRSRPSWAAASWTVFGWTPTTGSCPPTDMPPYLEPHTQSWWISRVLWFCRFMTPTEVQCSNHQRENRTTTYGRVCPSRVGFSHS